MKTIMLIGLTKGQKKVIKNSDFYHHSETHALGGGEWSLEIFDDRGRFVKEFVGLNGTQPGEEATDLYALAEAWAEKVAYSYREYIAPDGTRGSWSFFQREAEDGHLHGCLARF